MKYDDSAREMDNLFVHLTNVAIQAGQTVHSARSSSTHGHSGRSDSTHAEGQTVHTHEYSGRSDSTHAQVKQYTSMSTLSRHF